MEGKRVLVNAREGARNLRPQGGGGGGGGGEVCW